MTQASTSAISQPNLSPPVHRGVTSLDRETFRVDVPVLAAIVPAAKTTDYVKGQLKNYILRLPRFTHVTPEPGSDDKRRILLRTNDQALLPVELLDLLVRENVPLTHHNLQLTYDHWTADQILQSILPEDLLDNSPTAYTQVGHIAHLNLRDEYLPHRHLIGQVILDKNKTLKTVVNKLDSIDNTFRNFALEVLAGEEDFIVTHSEGGCQFRFDFSKVYWNSRLQTEHGGLVDTFASEDVVVDAFAGVGPFALPAAKKGCAVLASDLNPASAEALEGNVKLNKLEKNVRTGNEDARAFIRKSVLDLYHNPFPAYTPPLSHKARGRAAHLASQLPSTSSPSPASTEIESKPPRKLADHFIMNLPASAIEFLDSFRGLYRQLLKVEGAKEEIEKKGWDKLPLVHCYCFTKAVDDPESDILARATEALGMPVTKDLDGYQIRFVRDVAPKKEMYCLEFRLTREMVE